MKAQCFELILLIGWIPAKGEGCFLCYLFFYYTFGTHCICLVFVYKILLLPIDIYIVLLACKKMYLF